ncbi:MAG TPA: LEA type 2 family protein [Casimicrobiaceae bacterium]|nr:LEA type 2 family protein [Casimicrobiaceae bacterium]
MVKTALRAAVAVIAVLLSACAGVATRPEPPQVTLERVQILRIADAKADLSLRLRVANPNDFALAVDSLAFEIMLDGRPAARGQSTHIDTLPPRGEADLDVAGRVDVGVVATAMMSLASQRPVDYAMSGSATLAGGVVVPFSRKGQILVAKFDRAFGSRPQ